METGPVHLSSNPKNIDEALKNLFAFSREGRQMVRNHPKLKTIFYPIAHEKSLRLAYC